MFEVCWLCSVVERAGRLVLVVCVRWLYGVCWLIVWCAIGGCVACVCVTSCAVACVCVCVCCVPCVFVCGCVFVGAFCCG